MALTDMVAEFVVIVWPLFGLSPVGTAGTRETVPLSKVAQADHPPSHGPTKSFSFTDCIGHYRGFPKPHDDCSIC